MIALALALAVRSSDAAALAEDADILVLGRRLATMSTAVGRDDRGRFTCALSASSGNSMLDAQLCRAATRCVRRGARSPVATSDCIDRHKPALLADLRRALGPAAKP